MKTLIKSITLAIVLSLTVCIGVFVAGCQDKKDNQGEQYSVYVVYSDGSAVNGHTDGTGYDMATNTSTFVFVKWCRGELCPTPIKLGTDGKASYNAADLEKALGGKPDYVEVLYVKGNSNTDNVSKHVEITGTGEIKITLGAKG